METEGTESETGSFNVSLLYPSVSSRLESDRELMTRTGNVMEILSTCVGRFSWCYHRCVKSVRGWERKLKFIYIVLHCRTLGLCMLSDIRGPQNEFHMKEARKAKGRQQGETSNHKQISKTSSDHLVAP